MSPKLNANERAELMVVEGRGGKGRGLCMYVCM